MRIEKHVIKALEDLDRGDSEAALMQATIALEGTAKRLYAPRPVGASLYKQCVRNYYWIIQPMMGAGLNLADTKWHNIKLDNGRGKLIEAPDFADLTYHMYRCTNAHADEVPVNFQLLPKSPDGAFQWAFGPDLLQLPTATVYALLAVSVFSRANAGINVEGDQYLSYGNDQLGIQTTKFPLNEWWGREADFEKFITPKAAEGPVITLNLEVFKQAKGGAA